MARIFFVGLDGTEKSYRLQTHRPFTVGRDPGNDIILRDPKVSRHHAEIVFERGFFVLHDLASANGTYINGKRIRVAPLTHGAKLRMGNSYGRFSEELPTEADAPPVQEPLETPIPQQPTIAVDSGEIDVVDDDDVATDENSRISMETLPHEKLNADELTADELKKKIGVTVPSAPGPADEPPTEPITAKEPDRPKVVAEAEAQRTPFSATRFRFMTGLPAGETARIRDEQGQAALSYRSFASVVGIVAALTAAIVLIAGFAATAFLFAEHRPGAGLVALLLSIAFALLIAMLVPPTSVTLYDGQSPALTIAQDSRASFPVISFTIVTPDGIRLARIRRSFFSRLGRNRWQILDAGGRWLGEAVEESFGRAWIRKFAAKFNRRYDADIQLMVGGVIAGTIVRRDIGHGDVDVLDLPAGSPIDRRVAVALATLVLGSEP